MKKIKLYLFILTLVLLLPISVNAECNIAEKQNLLKLSKEIDYDYKYVSDNRFKITFYNIDEKLLLFNSIGNMIKNNEESFLTYKGGDNIKFDIISSEKSSCADENVKSIYVKFPVYNKYSENEICLDDKYMDFKYCKKFLNKEITNDEWDKELEKYKEKTNEIIKTDKKNYMFIIPIAISSIVIITIIITIIVRKKRKERRL